MKKLTKVFIKGMVCQRCIFIVRTQLEKAGLQLDEVGLGEVTLSAATILSDTTFIEEQLLPLGFTLLQDKRARLVKQVKSMVAEVYSGEFDFPYRFRFSELVAGRLSKDYDNISNSFSSLENTTLEKYIMEYRVTKIKEYLFYTNHTLADISFKLGFSSVAHISRQFKQQTGLTPSYFKSLKQPKETASSIL